MMIQSYGEQSFDKRGGRGFQMAAPNPFVEEWAKCYDGSHPLIDVGAAYGSNIEAAAAILNENGQEEDAEHARRPRFLAADFAPEHLAHIELTLKDEGVETVHCKLASELHEADELIATYGGVSAILCSEVFHFLRGDEIDASLKWFYEKLVPGGMLFFTSVSPFISNAYGDREATLKLLRDERRKGTRWPLSPSGEEFTHPVIQNNDYPQEFGGVDVRPYLSTSLHTISDLETVRAVTDVGFEITSFCMKFRDGYPEAIKYDGRECVCAAVMKPKAEDK